MPELVRLETPVRWEGEPPKTHPGRALNAWFYRQLAMSDDALAEGLHAVAGPKPFTVALVGAGDGLTLVITACGEAAPHVAKVGAGPGRFLLDGRWLEAVGDPVVKEDRYGEMASRWLLRGGRTLPARLDFLSPTTFHSRGRTLPLPLPELVFGGLLEKWQAWSRVNLGEGAVRALEQQAALKRHRLWTQMIQMEGKHAAFLGYAEYTLVKPDPAYAGLLALLGEFAEYAGVGQKTAMGLGCVRFRAPSLLRAEEKGREAAPT